MTAPLVRRRRRPCGAAVRHDARPHPQQRPTSTLDLIALVIATAVQRDPGRTARHGQGRTRRPPALGRRTHALCPGARRHRRPAAGDTPQSVAELAAELDLPVGVVRVLIGDLVDDATGPRHPSRTAGRTAGREHSQRGNRWPSGALSRRRHGGARRTGDAEDPGGGRLRRGQDHPRRRGQRDQTAAHRGDAHRGGPPGRRHRGCGGQDDHHRRHGLRPHHAQRGPGAVPLRHARPGPLLVPVGRAGAGRARRGRARRHPAAGGLLRRDRLLRAPRHPLHRRRQLLRGGRALPRRGRARRARPRPRGAGAAVRRARAASRSRRCWSRSSSTPTAPPRRTASASTVTA